MVDIETPTFIDVTLAPCEVAEDGLTLRFKSAGPARLVTEVAYESEDGVAGRWRVTAVDAEGDVAPDGARVARVEDSSDGTAFLVWGGSGGLRLHHVESGVALREPYLLLSLTTALV